MRVERQNNECRGLCLLRQSVRTCLVASPGLCVSSQTSLRPAGTQEEKLSPSPSFEKYNRTTTFCPVPTPNQVVKNKVDSASRSRWIYDASSPPSLSPPVNEADDRRVNDGRRRLVKTMFTNLLFPSYIRLCHAPVTGKACRSGVNARRQLPAQRHCPPPSCFSCARHGFSLATLTCYSGLCLSLAERFRPGQARPCQGKPG